MCDEEIFEFRAFGIRVFLFRMFGIRVFEFQVFGLMRVLLLWRSEFGRA